MNTADLKKLVSIDQRIPNWKPYPTEQRNCPFCGEYSAPLFLRPDSLPVSRCSTCKCFYVSRRVADEALNTFYDHYWTDTCPRPLTDEMAHYLLASASSRAAVDHCLLKLGALLGTWKGRKVLDLGCGFGEKATMMKALGAAVIGLEISAVAVAFMGDLLYIPVFHATVETLNNYVNHFDLITMFEFVEHPLEPREAISASFNKLRPGGLLAIVTPNGTEGERFMTDNNGWPGFRSELEHMQYLHVETLSYLAGELGFRILHLEQFGFRYEQAAPSHNTNSHPALMRLRRLVKGLPGVRQAVYTLRRYQERLRNVGLPSGEAGNYHLFAVLQKK